MSWRIAAVEAAEQSRVHEAHEEDAHTQRGGVACSPQFEITHAADENVSDNGIERAPEHVDGR